MIVQNPRRGRRAGQKGQKPTEAQVSGVKKDKTGVEKASRFAVLDSEEANAEQEREEDTRRQPLKDISNVGDQKNEKNEASFGTRKGTRNEKKAGEKRTSAARGVDVGKKQTDRSRE